MLIFTGSLAIPTGTVDTKNQTKQFSPAKDNQEPEYTYKIVYVPLFITPDEYYTPMYTSNENLLSSQLPMVNIPSAYTFNPAIRNP